MVNILDVLEQEGWTVDSDLHGTKHGVETTLPEIELLRCSLSVGRGMHPVVTLSGVYVDGRSICEIFSDVPVTVVSRDLALAFVAYPLRRFRFLSKPMWLRRGLAAQHLLPWEVQGLQERLYAQARTMCPKATVGRDWMRLARKQLVRVAKEADPDAICEIGFDGHGLKIRWQTGSLVLPAAGKAWVSTYSMNLAAFSRLPTRWQHDPVVISRWEDRIYFDGFPLP